ncbi:hypothetical protein BGX28_002248 [Mortierella sp. GBA30]|nr:hypothetical protein BGX28_002248 [Mortierella sp. GBA30]
MTAIHSSEEHSHYTTTGHDHVYDPAAPAKLQSRIRAGPVAFANDTFTHLTLYTDNIMRTGTTGLLASSHQKSNKELLAAVEETLFHSLEFAEIKDSSIRIANWSTLGPLEGDRSQYEITVKMFLLPCVGASGSLSLDRLNNSIQDLQTALGLSLVIDNFILALPNQTFDENGQDESELQSFKEDIENVYWSVWEKLSESRLAGQIKRLGVSEFSKQQLEILKDIALSKGAVAPEANQVNLQDCCVLPKDLIEYAKTEGIELLTHGDASNILPGPTLSSLLQTHLPATAASSLAPNCVLKYSSLITNRGLVVRKGYVVNAAAV